MSKELQTGYPAPDFTAIAVGGEYGDGTEVKLADFAGNPLVLYFYPKDDTPGCTTQACALRDTWPEVSKLATVFGVSIDPPASHTKFIAKHSLPFPLLSDSSKKLIQDYGVWVEKSMYGKKYMGTERTTFVINAKGQICSILRKIQPAAHVEQLLKALT